MHSEGQSGGGPEGAPGTMIAHRYRLEKPLGRGGMGVVWEALDTRLARKVAVKGLLYPGAAPVTRAQWVSRARREAQAIARIEHQNVVAVHDVIEDGEQVWIVMELLNSRSLADLLAEQGQLAVPHTARIGLQVLRGLIAVHRAGVVHRDVKPHNILFRPDGRALLMDFGIATFEGAVQVTRTHEIIGTAQYLAPELLARTPDQPRTATPASDLWALGITLYEMAEGRRPFEGMADLEVLVSVSESPVPPMRYAGPLAPLIEALLTKDPAQRPEADEAERMLQAVTMDSFDLDTPASPRPGPVPPAPMAAESAPASKPEPAPEPAPAAPRARADRWKVPVAVLCTALLAAGVFLWALPDDDSGTGDAPPSHKGGGTGESYVKRDSALQVGVKSDQPGLSVKKGGTFEGLEPALAKEIGERMGYDEDKIQFVPVTTSSRDKMLTAGEVDIVIATYTMNDQRRKKVDFVGPYYESTMGLLLKNERYKTVASLRESPTSEICTALGSTYDDNWFDKNRLTQQKNLPDVYEECVKKLKDPGTNMDAVATDFIIAKGYQSKHPTWVAHHAEGEVQQYGIAVRKSSDKDTLLLKKGVCGALSKITKKSSGRSPFEKLYDQHLKPFMKTSAPRPPRLSACDGYR